MNNNFKLILVTIILSYSLHQESKEQSLILELVLSDAFSELHDFYPQFSDENFLVMDENIDPKFYLKYELQPGIRERFYKLNLDRKVIDIIPEKYNSQRRINLLRTFQLDKHSVSSFWEEIVKDGLIKGIIRITHPAINGNDAIVRISIQWGPKNGFHREYELRKKSDDWGIYNRRFTLEY